MAQEKELLGFIIPNWALCSLINADNSGLENDDIAKIDSFVKKVHEEHGNASFMLGNEEEDNLGFKYTNDIDSLGSECTMLYILA